MGVHRIEAHVLVESARQDEVTARHGVGEARQKCHCSKSPRAGGVGEASESPEDCQHGGLSPAFLQICCRAFHDFVVDLRCRDRRFVLGSACRHPSLACRHPSHPSRHPTPARRRRRHPPTHSRACRPCTILPTQVGTVSVTDPASVLAALNGQVEVAIAIDAVRAEMRVGVKCADCCIRHGPRNPP